MQGGAVDVQTFMVHFARQFDALDPGTITAATRFMELPDWTSLQALIVVASFEHEYGVTMSADELRGSQTLGDLHAVVAEKLRG